MPSITYEPHTVLDIPTVIDASGYPDIADPHVIKVGPTWYLYATQTKLDMEVWASEDLKTWRNEGVVWAPTPGAWHDDGQMWAPHVEASGEGYYLYYTADVRIGVAWSADPTGPFEEVYDRPLIGDGYGGVGDGVRLFDGTPLEFFDWDENAIDAFVLKDSGGGLTIYFSAYDPVSAIYAMPMLDYVTIADAEPTLLLHPGVTPWEGLVIEGAWVIEQDGVFHLMYSGNGANSVFYAMGVATGPTPFGPFTRRADNPILRMNPDADFWGPGHHSVVEGVFDDLLIFYHTKVGTSFVFNRRIRYVPMSFDEAGQIQLDVPQP